MSQDWQFKHLVHLLLTEVDEPHDCCGRGLARAAIRRGGQVATMPVVCKLPLGPGGRPATAVAVTEIPLSGDWQQVPGFNANGIVATPQGQLIVVNSTLGALFHIDPTTGAAARIDVGGAALTAGDGLLLEGQTLYVVRNRFDEVVAVELDADFAAGTVTDTLRSAAFDILATVTRFGSALYAVNARFGVSPTPVTPYDVARFRWLGVPCW